METIESIISCLCGETYTAFPEVNYKTQNCRRGQYLRIFFDSCIFKGTTWNHVICTWTSFDIKEN